MPQTSPVSPPKTPSAIAQDCFAPVQGQGQHPGQALIPLASAIETLQQRLPCVCPAQVVPLDQAHGAILAKDVVAQVMVPPFANSAMDGYAVAAASLGLPSQQEQDTADTITLPVVRRIAAGDPPGPAVPAGAAVRIFTGAPLPPGADTVIMQETCGTDLSLGKDDGPFGAVTLPRAVKAGQNCRAAGEDVQNGQVVLSAGRRLRGADLSMAAATGHPTLTVRQPLRVALFSTGDELRPPGTPLEPGQIYDSNRYGVAGYLRAMGCEVTDLGSLPDDPGQIQRALEGAGASAGQGAQGGHHLIVTSGGVSVGEEDHVRAVLEAIGSLHFWRLALKPGKPLALGTVGDAAFLGLPGNPVAALVSLLVVGRAVIHQLQGRTATPLQRYRLPAAFSFERKPGRQEFIRTWLAADPQGHMRVERHGSQGSGVLSSLVRADGLVDIAAGTNAIAPGDLVDYIPITEALW